MNEWVQVEIAVAGVPESERWVRRKDLDELLVWLEEDFTHFPPLPIDVFVTYHDHPIHKDCYCYLDPTRSVVPHRTYNREVPYSYESEDNNGRCGVVTYMVPDHVRVETEADASEAAVDTRWRYTE